jgi:hypothetical protein
MRLLGVALAAVALAAFLQVAHFLPNRPRIICLRCIDHHGMPLPVSLL